VNKRGFCLYASSINEDWPSLVALQPGALVAIDPHHLPRALGPSCYWLWRPWVPGNMYNWTPAGWVERVHLEWERKGAHPFHGLQFLNEPRLESKAGVPDIIAWGRAVIALVRRAWGTDFDIHSPPLSPHVAGWEDCYMQLAPLIRECDVLNVHTYLDMPRSYEVPHQLYPAWPLVISECGDRGQGSAAYAARLQDWLSTLPAYVDWAAIYIYNSTDGQDPTWELHGTAAERVLIAEGPP